MKTNRILGLLVMALFAVNSFAQMTFTYSAEATESVRRILDILDYI